MAVLNKNLKKACLGVAIASSLGVGACVAPKAISHVAPVTVSARTFNHPCFVTKQAISAYTYNLKHSVEIPKGTKLYYDEKPYGILVSKSNSTLKPKSALVLPSQEDNLIPKGNSKYTSRNGKYHKAFLKGKTKKGLSNIVPLDNTSEPEDGLDSGKGDATDGAGNGSKTGANANKNGKHGKLAGEDNTSEPEDNDGSNQGNHRNGNHNANGDHDNGANDENGRNGANRKHENLPKTADTNKGIIASALTGMVAIIGLAGAKIRKHL